MTKLESLGIDRLSVQDRLDLIDEIYESLPESLSAADVPECHLAILAERLKAADARPDSGRPWRERWPTSGPSRDARMVLVLEREK